MSLVVDLRAEAMGLRPAVEADEALVTAAIATWRGRMINEYASSYVFEALGAQLAGVGAAESDIRACAAFAQEERSHGVLCGAVAEALGGEAIAVLPDPDPFPRHEDVGGQEGVLRNVLSIGCLSETIAVALIGAERQEMPDGELRDLLTRIWADEIGHARFGWRMVSEQLPALDRDARVRLSAYLSVAFRHLEAHELAHLPEAGELPEAGAALGLCNGRHARALFYSTVNEVIVPRLEHLGLAASRAWARR